MLNKLLRPTFDRLVKPVAMGLGRLGFGPNSLTVMGFLVAATACWLIAQGRLFAGGITLFASGAFDLFDGALAKGTGRVSKAGAFLDSTLDRLSDGLLFGAIAWYFIDTFSRGVFRQPIQGYHLLGVSVPVARLGFGLAVAALVLGYLVSYIKARAQSLDFSCDVGLAERGERILIPILGLIFGGLIPALMLLVLLSALTALQRFLWVFKQAQGSGRAA